MSMSLHTRRELAKLRELAWHLLEGAKCFFCKKLLVPECNIHYGQSTAPPFIAEITVHHKDGNHGNDSKENRTLAHAGCHKRHHIQDQHSKGIM